MARVRHDERTMSFGEHLDELRQRLVYALLGLVPIVVLALAFGRTLLDVLILPVQRALSGADLPAQLINTSPTEGFFAYVKISLLAAVVLASPWVLYQVWLFVAPGLYTSERRFAYVLAPLSVVLTGGALAFLYYVFLPLMLAFLIAFGASIGRESTPTVAVPADVTLPSVPVLEGDPEAPVLGQVWVNRVLKELRVCTGGGEGGPPVIHGTPLTASIAVSQQYRLGEYTSLVLVLGLSLVVAFQAPVVVLLLGWVGLVTVPMLRQYRRHAIFLCGVLGAVLTPSGDPVSMLALAVPLWALYELGALLLWLLPAHRVAGPPEDDADGDGP